MKILVFGDSIACGFSDLERGGWVDRLKADYITRVTGIEPDRYVYNLAVSGDTVGQINDRLENEFIARQGADTAIVLAAGVNESRKVGETMVHSVAEQKNAIEMMIKKATQLSRHVVVIGCTPSIDEKVSPAAWDNYYSYPSNEIYSIDRMLESAADVYGATYIRLWDVFDKYGIETLLPDGLHPNAKGHEVIYNEVKKKLDEIL